MTWTLASLGEHLGAEVVGEGSLRLDRVRSLEVAGSHEISFLVDGSKRSEAIGSEAGALMIPTDLREHFGGRNLLMVEDASSAMIDLLGAFDHSDPGPPGIHPTAIVADSASIHSTAFIGPYVVIGEGVTLGPACHIGAGSVVGDSCTIHEGTVLHPRVVLYPRTELGRRVEVHSGAVLGSDGFGYKPRDGRIVKVPQLGRLVVEDDVEIGANTAVDRATLEETRIGAGSKLDNLVQVGHNVQTGPSCLLCGQAGIAGSTTLGAGVVLGGKAGVTGHVKVADGVQVGGAAAVLTPAETPGEILAGAPAGPIKAWRRQVVMLKKLPELFRRLKRLERKMDEEG